ncbi:hypothetical protein [Chitinophaga flava]|uniref:hypothetical protein n=1 Tax=Chitinophaga flava TaxID=2259036 RepID=UPI0011BE0B9C|nr:hypothetical protein [Chitinophaga flava]
MSGLIHLVPFAGIVEEVKRGAGITFVPGTVEYGQSAAIDGCGSTGKYPYPFPDSGIRQGEKGGLLLGWCTQGNQQEKNESRQNPSPMEEKGCLGSILFFSYDKKVFYYFRCISAMMPSIFLSRSAVTASKLEAPLSGALTLK